MMQRLAVLCMALLCTAPAAMAAEVGACPGAAAWVAAHPQESDAARAARDAARSFTDPALRAELAERAARDQRARSAALASGNDSAAWRAAAQVDKENVFRLQALVRAQAVEANRRALGVMPLADYVCMLSEARRPQS
jgi:hypothetical protein